jgi:hypothetical protein
MRGPLRSEADLVDAFLASAASTQAGDIVLREFETLAGIPDVVGVENRGDRPSVLVEIQGSVGLVNGHAKVMACLSRSRPHTVTYLSSRTRLGSSYVNRLVADLRRVGLAEVTSRGSVQLGATYTLPLVSFTAMEFKLANWRRALAQAVRHQSFADKTVVVMPASKEAVLRNAAEAFRSFGVGSAVFDPTIGLKYVVRPRRRRRRSDRIFLDAVGRVSAALDA